MDVGTTSFQKQKAKLLRTVSPRRLYNSISVLFLNFWMVKRYVARWCTFEFRLTGVEKYAKSNQTGSGWIFVSFYCRISSKIVTNSLKSFEHLLLAK